MSSECDIEELKHIALQKFIELADVDNWVKEYPFMHIRGQHRQGEYTVFQHDGLTTSYSIRLGNESIFVARVPSLRQIKTTKTGKPDKNDAKKAAQELAEAQKIFEGWPAVIAIRKIEARQAEKECREREIAMKKAMDQSCKVLQKALKGTEETMYSVQPSYPTDRKKRWWEVWK